MHNNKNHEARFLLMKNHIKSRVLRESWSIIAAMIKELFIDSAAN